ncbi:MAG: YtxH domain-containing protein [Sphingobacteriales bacterium]|nr:YtxH domain-containing protein [Sphingobacteriales bacterium]MCC7223438.1 YtxH domain-containing protein [Chitinophagales bacterium]
MKKTLFLLIVGIAIGAIAALLYAPQSGRKTRKKIGKQARKLQLELEARGDRNFDRFNHWRNSVEEMAEDTVKHMNGSASSAELN